MVQPSPDENVTRRMKKNRRRSPHDRRCETIHRLAGEPQRLGRWGAKKRNGTRQGGNRGGRVRSVPTPTVDAGRGKQPLLGWL